MHKQQSNPIEFSPTEVMTSEPFDPMEQTVPNQDLRKIIAIGTIGLVGIAGTQEATPAQAAEKATPVTASTDTSSTKESHQLRLRNPNTLEGRKFGVNAKAKIAARRSTVKIVRKLKGISDEPYNWAGTCSGNKVSLRGTNGAFNSNYVSTALHCFGEATGAAPSIPISPKRTTDKIFNYVANSPYDYAVAAPNTTDGYRVIGKVSGIYGQENGRDNLKGTDLALLRIVPTKNTSEVTGIDWRNVTTTDIEKKQPKPIPGQKVALGGIPGDGVKTMTGTGEYIGQTTMWINDTQQTLYVVGLPKTASRTKSYYDECYFGASGSSFTYNPVKNGKLSSNVAFSGPLAFRINTTRDVDHGHYAVEWGQTISPAQQRKNAQSIWTDTQNAVRVNLGKYESICGFTANNAVSYRALLRGSGNPAPPILTQK